LATGNSRVINFFVFSINTNIKAEFLMAFASFRSRAHVFSKLKNLEMKILLPFQVISITKRKAERKTFVSSERGKELFILCE
jgi:hypothetical protein